MPSSKELKAAWKLSSKQKIMMFEPNERFILWIVVNDPKAFDINFMMDIAQNQALMKPDPTSNLTKALNIFLKLIQREFIKQNGLEYKVTPKGQLYRFVTNPFFPLFALLFAASIAITLGLYNHKPTETPPKSSKDSTLKQQTNLDSSVHHQKILKDSSKK